MLRQLHDRPQVRTNPHVARPGSLTVIIGSPHWTNPQCGRLKCLPTPLILGRCHGRPAHHQHRDKEHLGECGARSKVYLGICRPHSPVWKAKAVALISAGDRAGAALHHYDVADVWNPGTYHCYYRGRCRQSPTFTSDLSCVPRSISNLPI